MTSVFPGLGYYRKKIEIAKFEVQEGKIDSALMILAAVRKHLEENKDEEGIRSLLLEVEYAISFLKG